MTNIYVGNLAYQTSSTDLEDAFGEFGDVSRAAVVSDRESGRSKGFGFVEMPNDGDAQSAIDAMNDRDLDGRNLKVNVAKPREQRTRN
ncbi:RNA recognition motif domain-containing protein [Fuerstiella marisgermanici]|uniref:Splicing factor, CC1-like family n=1 Tax=Fuerstiella marisgermanici TaxID=1891926 RepID=A0A1P8WQY1_9PLAN|nr:RNA-binding protein [Fuerstiella marisgermanici]APZ96476.1 splicing factor, CC1-like family [Fuerstiella marisgermanici]